MENADHRDVEERPLVELAPEEVVLPALMQSAHPVEFLEANRVVENAGDADES